MKRSFSLLLLTFFNLFLFSQTVTENRIEFELKNGFSNERIIPLEKEGFVLLAQEDGASKKESIWKAETYNTDLKKTNTKFITLHKAKYLEKSVYSKNYFYGVFVKSKFRGKTRKIVKLNLHTLESTIITADFPKKFILSNLKINGDNLIFLGKIKRNFFCFSYNVNTQKRTIIPLELKNPKKSYIQNIDTTNKNAFIFINDWNKKDKKVESKAILIDKYGNKANTFIINDNEEFNLKSTSISAGEGEDIFYTGTYSKSRSNISTGIFFAKGTSSKITFLKTYNYLEFDNFLNYLPEKKIERVKKRTKRKKEKGKDYSLNYYMAAHDILVFENQYIYIGEAYYPTYRQEARTTVNSKGQAITTYVTVFDGYQYTHSVIASFNKQGELLWDQSLKMELEYKPFRVKKFIKVQEKNNTQLSIAFATGKSIKTLSIDFSGKISKEESFEIVETNIEGDDQKWTISNLEHWYDRYYLMYGSQKIKNKEKKGIKRKRRVFFINKLKY